MPPPSSLSLSREEMRALGYRVIDQLVDYFDGLPERRVHNEGRRAALDARIREPLPAAGKPPEEVLERLRRDVFSHISHADHPRFFAFIPSPSNYVSVLAEALAAGHNVFAGTWIESSGPAVVELTVLDWLRERCGLPETAGGLFTSGGSAANLTALAAARQLRLGDDFGNAVLYYSDQTHSSIDRAVRILGFRQDQIRRLPADDAFRLDLAVLREAIAEDRAAGRRPFCVVANAGTTNTGAVDPLPALADLCAEAGLWLHVDGAYGAGAVFCAQGREALRGLERVDSVSIDPHKWLFQPFETGCLLVRDRRDLREVFHILPEYMRETARPEAEEVNFCDYGIQLTRGFRALKLWMSIQVFGGDAFEAAVAHGFHLAEAAEAYLRRMPGWEVVTPAQMGIVSFRYAPDGLDEAARDDANNRVVAALLADGFAMLTSTVLHGRTVLRLCPINPRTTEADVYATLDRLGELV